MMNIMNEKKYFTSSDFENHTIPVSVIIPVYDVYPYLCQCLDSVIQQSYPNLDIIIIDDGSTDGCGVICDKYAQNDKRIHVFHTDNRGLSAARNIGLDHAKGSYLLFIDSDDWIELNHVETLLSTAIQTKADIVIAQRCLEFVGKTIHPEKKESVQIFQGKEILPAYAKGLFGDISWNKLYRSECFMNIRYPVGYNYEDVYINWKQIKALAENDGTVVTIPEALIHFRIRKSSISHTVDFNNIYDRWNAYRSKYDGLPEYRKKVVVPCISIIGSMWANYCKFTKDEKQNAKATIAEMETFSREVFPQIIKGDYSRTTKMICILSLTKAPAVMWACYYGNKLRSFIHKNREFIMFE